MCYSNQDTIDLSIYDYRNVKREKQKTKNDLLFIHYVYIYIYVNFENKTVYVHMYISSCRVIIQIIHVRSEKTITHRYMYVFK